jgi:hypothetical protein
VRREEAACRERHDLVRRVQCALEVASRSVAAATTEGSSPDRETGVFRSGIRPLVRSKVVAEAAMLLRCAAFLADSEPWIGRAIDGLARQLAPAARGDALLVALCREPALALDHAAAHIHLAALGHPDARVDRLLVEIAQGEPVGGPERLPNHELEHWWLAQIWSGSDAPPPAGLLARTCVARPLDALGSSTAELYAFTHVVLHASDMGRRPLSLPRAQEDIAADAEAALAAALDADNLDLTAELLWTWPMLGLPWSAAATFAFDVLAAAQDAHGFLPGPDWSADDAERLPAERRDAYLLRTSYHATLVMGFLCAAALRPGREPTRTARATPVRSGAVDAVLALAHERERTPRWRSAFAWLAAPARESLAGLVLSIALRRARAAQDVERVRRCLAVWQAFELAAGPSVRQGLALLRRVTLLAETDDRTATDSYAGRPGRGTISAVEDSSAAQVVRPLDTP